MLELTDANFESEVKEADIPVVVDFGASWCGPCVRIKPIMEDLANEYDGRVKIATFDVDASPQTPAMFRIMSVPTLVFFKGGEPVDQVIGLQPRQALKDRIEKLLD